MMTFTQFKRKYKPIRVSPSPDAPIEGYLITGINEAEMKALEGHTSETVWTLLEEDGQLYLESGIRFVNRLGYVVCQVPELETVQVKM